MNTHTSSIERMAVVVWLIPLAYLLYTYPSLPDTVPMHFDGKGKPDGFGSKHTHLYVMLGMWVFNLGMYLLLKNVYRLDPKSTAKISAKTFDNLAFAILLFLSIVHIVIVYATQSGGFVIDRLLFVLIGALFSYLGWIMRNIEPNYFVGIRTPWTLEDPENWRATHRFGSKWFLWGGVVIIATSLILPRQAVLFTAIAGILGIAFVPIIYSYRYFAKSRKKA
jgi:uncharacterized membrane protein